MSSARRKVSTPEVGSQKLLEPFGLPNYSTYQTEQFAYDPNGYLYLPVADNKQRVVLFHASAEDQPRVMPQSREARMEYTWRKNARGPGFYGGNTPLAAASSMVVGKNAPARTMQAYLTHPMAPQHIRDRRKDPTYYMPMVRAQFSDAKGQEMVHAQIERDGDDQLQILSPGLVSRAKTDGYVRGSLLEQPIQRIITPSWLRVVAQPESVSVMPLERIGVLEQDAMQLVVEQGIVNKAAFACAALRRVALGALQ